MRIIPLRFPKQAKSKAKMWALFLVLLGIGLRCFTEGRTYLEAREIHVRNVAAVKAAKGKPVVLEAEPKYLTWDFFATVLTLGLGFVIAYYELKDAMTGEVIIVEVPYGGLESFFASICAQHTGERIIPDDAPAVTSQVQSIGAGGEIQAHAVVPPPRGASPVPTAGQPAPRKMRASFWRIVPRLDANGILLEPTELEQVSIYVGATDGEIDPPAASQKGRRLPTEIGSIGRAARTGKYVHLKYPDNCTENHRWDWLCEQLGYRYPDVTSLNRETRSCLAVPVYGKSGAERIGVIFFDSNVRDFFVTKLPDLLERSIILGNLLDKLYAKS